MATPSSLYDVDYTDSNGLKWTKTIVTLYPSLGAIDNSIAISKYDAEIMQKIYRKPDTFNPLYDNAITIGGIPGSATDVIKYFQRSDYPSSDININTIIVDASTADGGAYAIGVNDDAVNVINRASMGSYRILRDVEYNKMLFNVRVREMSFTTHSNVIQKDLYDDPTYTDINLKDIDDDKYYAIFYHLSGKVWNGSTWVNSSINPAYICIGSDNQTIQGAGSVFNNTFVTYSAAPLGTGQNISLLSSTSNYYWSGENFNSKMNNVRYCLGLSEDIALKGSWTDNPDAVYSTIRQWLIDNSIAPNVRVNFEVCRELLPVGNDSVVLFTQDMSAYLDNNNNLVIWGSTVHTFFMVKGSSVNKMIAGFGLYYLADENADLTGITPANLGDSSNIWLGEMSANGSTTGRWIKGSDIDNYTGYNKDGNIINPDFDPSGGGGGADNPWDVDPETYGWSGGEVSGMVKYYLLTAGQMSSLQTAIASNANWTIDYLNCIVSCFVVPNSGIFFDAPIPTTVKFKLDNATEWDTGVACSRIQGTKNKSGGTIEIPRLTRTFYDFEPYSDYSVYIPFCGRVPIKGNVCLGREIKVTYYPDVPTCSLTAVVSCGGATIAIAKGSFGTMTPVTSNGSDRKTAAVIGDVAPIITGIGTGIAGVALGNPLIVGAGAAQALGGIMGGVKESVQSYAYSVGSTGDSSFFGAGNRCYYYANYPIIDEVVNNSMFGHSVGYLCNSVGKLSGFTGFTICANPHVTFSATAEEREEIEKLLSMGVIL